MGCEFHQKLCSPVFCSAVTVLWLTLHKEKFPLLARTLQAAAGVTGKQQWALILPSSARVSMVTYTTVIAVRYPELDNSVDGLVNFGNYLLGAQSTHGGFLPVFWNAPTAYMHAAADIGCVVEWMRSQFVLKSDENRCLAVLHNRNKMVTTFGNSEWVTQAEGSVQSKSVTSCAGMTAHLVLLAQTRVGFLSGGRGKRARPFPSRLPCTIGRGLCPSYGSADASTKVVHHYGPPGHAWLARCHWLFEVWSWSVRIRHQESLCGDFSEGRFY